MAEDNAISELEAARRRALPAWIREGLEKVEKEKRRTEEKERLAKQREEHRQLRRKREEEELNNMSDEQRAAYYLKKQDTNKWSGNGEEEGGGDREEEEEDMLPPMLKLRRSQVPIRLSPKERLRVLLKGMGEEEKLRHVVSGQPHKNILE